MVRMRKDELASRFWRIVQIEELVSDRRRLWSRQLDDGLLEVAFTRSGLWILVDWGSGASVAFRAAFSPGGLTAKKCSVEDDGLLIEADTRIGLQMCEVAVGTTQHVMSFRTTVIPRSYLTFEAWSTDVVPLAFGSDGTLHSSTADQRAGQVHASIAAAGSFLYLQQLSSLAALCGATRATLARTVGGEWPDVGFCPPRGRKALRPCDGPTVLSHAHVAWSGTVPTGPGEVIEQQLALLE